MATGDIATAATKRLAKCPHPNIHVAAIDAEVLANATSGSTHRTDRMRLVHHQPALVAVLDFNEFW